MLGIKGVIFDMDGVVFREIAVGAHVRGEQGVKKAEGLDELLEYLRDYMVPTAALSYRSRPHMEMALEKGDILYAFDVLVPRCDLFDANKSVAILDEAAELLGVSRGRALVLADDAELARRAAAAGFRSVLVTDASSGSVIGASSVLAVRTLDELIDLLEEGALA